MRNAFARLRNHNVRFIFPAVWFVSTVLTSFVALIMLTLSIGSEQNHTIKYNIFAANPLVLGTSTSSVDYKNAREEMIDAVFDKYNCPMHGLGKKFVEEADKNNIPFWVVASIAFQESSCGKNVPYKDGVLTHNAYGYGVWGDNMTSFESWEHGIEVMSRYMNNKFYSKGVTDLCEIMKTYTPPSKGSWCSGVEFFMKEITEFKTNVPLDD